LSKAIVDTTILTDVLLNSGEVKAIAESALSLYDQTLLPVYAIKEFKAGPLKNFVWMHNKLSTLGSYEKSLDALQRMSRTPRRYTTSTAIQGLKEASKSIGRSTPSTLVEKYGATASLDRSLCDEFRLALKTIIQRSWIKRRKVTTHVVCPLSCYREVAPFERRGLLDLEPRDCTKNELCSMSLLLKQNPDKLQKMREAIKNSEKQENKRRAKVLRQLYRLPKQNIDTKDCQSLGDAVFVFLAEDDMVILTTNVLDHDQLAKSVGKKAVSPNQLIK